MKRGTYAIGAGLVALFVAGLLIFAFKVSGFSVNGISEGDDAALNDTVRVCENLTYGGKERNVYDLYIPAAVDKREEHALILFLHGGSWTSGDKASMVDDCRFFAERGYVTATMNYSFLNMMGEDKVDFTTMMTEIATALSTIKDYAVAQGVNITKVALSGYSAGAHLALLYTYSMAGHSPLPVLFVHSKAGPADFRTFSPSSPDVRAFMAKMGVGSDEKSVRELLKNEKVVAMVQAVSPIFYVKGEAAPAILSYGRKDALVVWENVVSMMNVLDANVVDYKLIEYPNSGHGLDKDADSAQRSVDAMLDYAKKFFGY